MISYELWLHWKQGDEFRDLLDVNDGVTEALEKWAEIFRARADHCEELASVFEGEKIEGTGDTHLIAFSGDEEVLEEAAERDLIERRESPDEEIE